MKIILLNIEFWKTKIKKLFLILSSQGFFFSFFSFAFWRCCSVVSWLPSLLWGWPSLYHCSSLEAFSMFSVPLQFDHLCLGVVFYMFTLLGVHRASKISKLMSFTKFVKIWAIISLNNFLTHSVSLLSFLGSRYIHVRLLDVVLQDSEVLFIFL